MSQEANFAGAIPRFYDRQLGPVLFETYAETMAQRVVVDPVSDVLEIAAGTGILTRRLADCLPAGARLVATDVNPDMLAVAREKFAADERATFQIADAQNLPFTDAAFDAVVCQFGLMFFPDKDRAHREARRVLKPGGAYHVSVWDSMDANPFAHIAMNLLRSAFPSDPPPFLETPFGFHAIDPIRSALRGAGFADVRFEILPRIVQLENFRAFAEGVALGSPLADQIRARGVEPASLVEEIAAAFEQAFGAARAMPLSAILFHARAG